MKKIAEIVSEIKDELYGAEHYAKRAAQYKEEDKSLADAYSAMASQELNHVEALHAQVVRVIQEHRAENGEPPKSMLVIWDWEHGKIIEHTARVKALLEMYKK